MSTQAKTSMPLRLCADTLRDLPEGVLRPKYDRARITPGIVHIGLGNFHRAHQAWYLHRLMQSEEALDWGIIGAGVRAPDEEMRQRLARQDFLYTLIELDPASTTVEVVGSMIDFLPVEEHNASLIRTMSDPAIRIVALTVTEGGYFRDPANGAFAADDPEIQHDAANPAVPHTAFGAIVAALANRRAKGQQPFTVQSCDNLQGNGGIVRDTVVSLARMSDATLANWIAEHSAFPNSMVDCIVPATGAAEIALAKDIGIDDAAPVTHESFRQWVIEDNFCAGRPPWERVGATLTQDVHAYESMKIRVLNAGHQVLANAGEILSLPTISACMKDDDVAAFFRKVQREEILPYVASVPEMDREDYLALIERRFSNPTIHDTTRRVAFDGSSRHTGFVMPILRDAIEAGGSVRGLALVEALWARMCTGVREDGSEIAPNDPIWTELQAAAMATESRPQAWLEQQKIYGDIGDAEDFAAAFSEWSKAIRADGCRGALVRYVDRG